MLDITLHMTCANLWWRQIGNINSKRLSLQFVAFTWNNRDPRFPFDLEILFTTKIGKDDLPRLPIYILDLAEYLHDWEEKCAKFMNFLLGFFYDSKIVQYTMNM